MEESECDEARCISTVESWDIWIARVVGSGRTRGRALNALQKLQKRARERQTLLSHSGPDGSLISLSTAFALFCESSFLFIVTRSLDSSSLLKVRRPLPSFVGCTIHVQCRVQNRVEAQDFRLAAKPTDQATVPLWRPLVSSFHFRDNIVFTWCVQQSGFRER